jgi:fructose-bisphosphate aldolase class II
LPIATPEVYAEMLDRAKAGQFAYPAINVTSSQTMIAALAGFAEAGSTASSRSPPAAPSSPPAGVKDMVTGAVALAEFANEVAENYPVNVALHTDHCPKDKLDGFVRPLVDISASSVSRPASCRCSSRTCGTARPCRWRRTSTSPRRCSPCHPPNIILEVEIGVVGGEEDGVEAKHQRPSSTPPPRTAGHRRGAGPRGAWPLHGRR